MEHFIKKNTSCFIGLPGIFHAGREARGDRPEICEQAGRDFFCRDYPHRSISLDTLSHDIAAYMHTQGYEKYIICGLSFGEIVARRVLALLSTHSTFQTNKSTTYSIIHISLCGVSIYDDLSVSKKKRLIQKLKITNHITVNIIKSLLALGHHIEHHGIFGYGKHWIGKKEFWNIPTLSSERKNAIICAGSKGLTPSLLDRRNIICSMHDIMPIHYDTVVIYARHDPFFHSAQGAAQRIYDACTEKRKMLEIHHGGHASLVELPDEYNDVLRMILQTPDISI